MLQLASGIRFGMDVGNLLHLQRAFHRNRIMNAAAEEQHVLLVGKLRRPLRNRRLRLQHMGQCRRQVTQRV